MEDMDGTVEHTAPVWAVFGDLMSGLLGAFVLILVSVLAVQMELATKLEAEINKRQIEEKRRTALEDALAIPLASGRVTLTMASASTCTAAVRRCLSVSTMARSSAASALFASQCVPTFAIHPLALV